MWEDLRDWITVFAFSLKVVAGRIPRPKLLLFIGYAPGDDLMCTAVLRELRKRGQNGLVMVTDHPELFSGNEDVAIVQRLWRRYDRYGSAIRICRRIARLWSGQFVRPEGLLRIGPDQLRSPSRHIVAQMCARAGITGQVAIRPYLVLTEAEKASASWAAGCVVVQSSGLAARHPARNKEWYPERLQDVVDALRGELSFVQLGSATDPTVRHARDLRGATDKRTSAAILYHARLFVGTVGFPMHLARAVGCPAVIMFGSEAPWQSGYVCNRNLFAAVPCAPCWRQNECPFAHRCMDAITGADVVCAIRAMLARPREPLAVETVEIVAEGQRP